MRILLFSLFLYQGNVFQLPTIVQDRPHIDGFIHVYPFEIEILPFNAEQLLTTEHCPSG